MAYRDLIEKSGRKIAVSINSEICLLYWQIGNYISTHLYYENYSQYGAKILATLSQTLSWSHFIELATIEEPTKRYFYQQMCIAEQWSVRKLREQQDLMLFERTAIASKPNDEIETTLVKVNAHEVSPDVVFNCTTAFV